MPRLYVDTPLHDAQDLSLPAGPARHVQVLRLQPGDALSLFDGSGHEWPATIARMGRNAVDVVLGQGEPVDRELPVAVTLALAVPANDRMDWVVEKATELGVAAIQPLTCTRSVLRLSGERAQKRQAHWQGVAVAASEQCGRAKVPVVHPVRDFSAWVEDKSASGDFSLRAILSLAPPQSGLVEVLRDSGVLEVNGGALRSLSVLSGPEGGFTEEEEAQARAAGWRPVQLGPRVLRADTAPVTVMGVVGGVIDKSGSLSLS